jgi:calcineurin-like phosphoesterase family protein
MNAGGTAVAIEAPAAPPRVGGARTSPDEVTIRTGHFAVVGDLQPTSRLEFWRESNAPERERIVDAIVRSDPDFLALLGDLVFCGSSTAGWSRFDRVCSPLKAARTRLLPVLGNHEYWFSRPRALRNFFARFPALEERRWYSARYGPVGLVFLDSNVRFLSGRQWRDQRAWYDATLAAFESDPDVRGTLVFLHHPPFTNSTLTSDERHVQRFFVPAFRACRKTLAMIAGHVHSYERFERGGKAFLVAGGGGAPRVRLADDARRRHSDDAFEGPSVRFFHYLDCRIGDEALEVEVRALEKGEDEVSIRDRFSLLWPAGGSRRTGV